IASRLFAEGYGSEIEVDDRTGITWAQFQHLYVPFYTFQYASGISAAAALAKQLRSEPDAARERVIGFLSSGHLRKPLDTLKRARVDLTTDEPIEEAFRSVEVYLDRLEELAAQRG